MAKKKKKIRPNQFRPLRKSKPSQAPDHLPDLPDRRTLEAGLHNLIGDRAAPGTPQRQAQDLLDRAFRERNPTTRVELARQAIALWPDCADGFVLLAEHSRGGKEALGLYRQAVEAGERALGPDGFRDATGRFWGLLQTRPYMRARLGLVHSLWTAGQRQEAVGHAQELLRLNPNDNQGVRYSLAGFLLALDRDGELAQLLAQHSDEGSATWAYTKALLAFRREGDSPEARNLLQAAKRANRYVPDYLLRRKAPPQEQPSSYSPGKESEALIYIGGFLTGWRATAGAVAWLRANDEQTLARKAKAPRATGPLGFIKSWLKSKLPQQNDVWQAECRLMPHWYRFGGDPVRLWLILVMSRTNDLVLAHTLVEDEPQLARLWDTLLQAMQNPAVGEPHRPTELQVRPDPRWEAVRPHLEEVGVTLTTTDGLDQVSAALQGLSEHLSGPVDPGLLDTPGVGPEQGAAFYDAAATFFEQAPWKEVGYESAIQVTCERFQGGPWYGVLLGQSGLTNGLALYDDLQRLRRLFVGGSDDRTSALSVMFGEEWQLPVADLDASRRFGWRVARSDAYPSAIHKGTGQVIRLPLPWELELLEVCLRTMPELVRRRRQDDPTREESTVRIGTEDVKVSLAWVVRDNA